MSLLQRAADEQPPRPKLFGMLTRDVRSATRPDPFTGWVGTLYAVILFGAYSYFISLHHSGGGRVPNLLAGTLPANDGKLLAFDFFDGILMLALVLAAMASWERLTLWRRKLFWAWFGMTAFLQVATCANLANLPIFPISGLRITSVTLGLTTAVLGFVGLFALQVGSSEARKNRVSCTWGRALRIASSRWLAAMVLVSLLALLSLTHPYFATSGTLRVFRLFVGYYWLAFAILGLPYFTLSERLRYRKDDPRKDLFFPSYCLLVHLARSVGRLLGLSKRQPRLRQLWSKRWMRFSLLDLVVKGFFFPIMLGFLFGELGTMSGGWHLVRQGTMQGALAGTYRFTLHTVLLIDVAIGAIGYIASSRWLGNKSVSVDPTAGGWAIALFCYPPFNSAAGALFPHAQGVGNDLLPSVFVSLQQGAVLILFAIYTWATIVFGLRFSNLTNRGIIDHGPYAYVRHPAYISKALAWGFEFLPKFSHWWHPVSLVLFAGIYGLRAMSEERHLMADPEYRKYCKKVKYRFIPGII